MNIIANNKPLNYSVNSCVQVWPSDRCVDSCGSHEHQQRCRRCLSPWWSSVRCGGVRRPGVSQYCGSLRPSDKRVETGTVCRHMNSNVNLCVSLIHYGIRLKAWQNVDQVKLCEYSLDALYEHTHWLQFSKKRVVNHKCTISRWDV